MTESSTARDTKTFSRRSLIAAATMLAVVAFGYFVWTVGSGLLVLFVCIVLGIVFDAIARFIGRHTRIGRKAALALTVFLLLLGSAIGVKTGGVGLFEEMPNLTAQLESSVNEVNRKLSRIGWIRSAAGNSKPASNVISMGTQAFGDIGDVATLTLGAVADLFVVFVVGVYLAWSPQVYIGAFVSLFPERRRNRMREVIDASGNALRRWILGQLAAMAMVFVFVGVGLLLLGINMALPLAAIAGLLTFIPYLGGIIAAVPAILIAFLVSPIQAAWVALLFLASYTVEGYFFTPLIQQRAISIAPAFLLVAQLLAAHFSGLAGVLIAAPLSVVLTVAVQMLYRQDVLGDSLQVLGADAPSEPGEPRGPEAEDETDSLTTQPGST